MNIDAYRTRTGDTIRVGDQVSYTGPLPLLPGHWHTITELRDYGSWVEALLDDGAHEVAADHLRPAPPTTCHTCGANLRDGSGDGVNGHWSNCTA